MIQASKQIYVIKIGGEILSAPTVFENLCEEIAALYSAGINLVCVHGGGTQVTQWDKKLGNNPNIINGRRVTNATTLETIKMIFGKINIEILSALQSKGVSCVGLSGVDGGILNVNRRGLQEIVDNGQKKIMDYGFVGDITAVNPSLLTTLLAQNFVPVIAPLAADKNGVIYNINADTVACAIARALDATKWIVMTNVDGVLNPQKETFSHLTCHQSRLLIDQGVITGGMIPKIESIICAIQSGLKSVQIINGTKAGNLKNLLTANCVGTLITSDV